MTIVGTPTDFGNIRNEFYVQNYPREVLFSIKFVNLAKCQISGMFVSRPHISATESRRELAFAPFDAKWKVTFTRENFKQFRAFF